MSKLFLKWFGGMRPRMGDQHLTERRLQETGIFRAPQQSPDFEINTGVHATEAENCNLYSGELRPLKKPALAHKFCRPGDECWREPLPDDPSNPPEPPPEPPDCIPVDVGDPCKTYECDAYESALLTSGIDSYWPFNNGDAGTDGSLIDGGRILDRNGINDLYIDNNPVAYSWVDGILPDACVGATALRGAAIIGGTGLRMSSIYPPRPTLPSATNTGVIGATVRYIGNGMDNAVWVSFGINDTTTGQTILSFSEFDGFSSITVRLQTRTYDDGGGYISTLTDDILVTGLPKTGDAVNVQVAWQTTGVGIGASTTATVYADWDFSTPYGSITLDGELNSVNLPFSSQLLVADPDVEINHAFVTTSIPDTDALMDALAQNKSTYVDPNPDCGGLYVTDNGITYPAEAGTQLVLTVAGIPADTTPPIQYQWYKNSVVLSGEVGPVLTYTLQASDSYASFSVLVQNPCGFGLIDAITVGEVTDQPLCKVYECDAYSTTVLLGDIASYTMTDEAAGLNAPLTDKSGDIIRTENSTDIVQGPFIGWDACSNDNFVDRLGDNYYFIAQNGNGTDAWADDPTWVTGMDDATVHGFFKLEPLTTSSVGTIIGFDASTYEFNLDVRIKHEADGLGDRIQLYWTGGAGGNSPRSWISDKIPEMNILSGDLFWFGAHVLRTGSETDAIVSADFYFSDLQPGSVMQKVASMPAGTLTGALWKFSKVATYGFPLRVGISINYDTVINSSSTAGDSSNIAVEWSELTDARLAALQDGYERNFSTYVDPNPNCRPPV